MPSAIDTIDDLIRSNLTITGPATFKDMIWQNAIRERYRDHTNPGRCTNDLLKGDRVACLLVKMTMGYFLPRDMKFLVSRDNLLERSITYNLVTNWPLLDRFNLVLLLINEGGFIEYLNNREEYLKSNESHPNENVKEEHLYDRLLIVL